MKRYYFPNSEVSVGGFRLAITSAGKPYLIGQRGEFRNIDYVMRLGRLFVSLPDGRTARVYVATNDQGKKEIKADILKEAKCENCDYKVGHPGPGFCYMFEKQYADPCAQWKKASALDVVEAGQELRKGQAPEQSDGVKITEEETNEQVHENT